MFLTRALQSWHPNSILITRPAFMSSQWGQKREANFPLCRPPIIMSLHQKQRKVKPLISFRSTTESQRLWGWKACHIVGEYFRTENYQARDCKCLCYQIHMRASGKKHHHRVWPPGQLEMSVPPQTLKYERKSAQCWSGVHLVPTVYQKLLCVGFFLFVFFLSTSHLVLWSQGWQAIACEPNLAHLFL